MWAFMSKEYPVIVGADCPGTPIMSENSTPYRADPAGDAKSPTTPDDLVALAHAHRQGVPYETGEQLLARLPERLCTLADWMLGDKISVGEMAYALIVDRWVGKCGGRRRFAPALSR